MWRSMILVLAFAAPVSAAEFSVDRMYVMIGTGHSTNPERMEEECVEQALLQALKRAQVYAAISGAEPYEVRGFEEVSRIDGHNSRTLTVRVYFEFRRRLWANEGQEFRKRILSYEKQARPQ